MMCLQWAKPCRVVSRLTILLLGLLTSASAQQAEPGDRDGTPGQFFTIEQPIDSDRLEGIKASTRNYLRDAAARGESPIVVFEIRPGDSDYGLSIELADFIARRLEGARKTVAFVPESLSGFSVLVALACDEIVMGPETSLGPISPPDEPSTPGLVGFVEELARRKGRSPGLAVGMLDPSAELLRVRTADGRTDYVLAERLDDYREAHQVIDQEPAWEAGARGVLTAQRARSEGLAQSLAEDRSTVARAYDIRNIADDPTLAAENLLPVWIRVDGPIDSTHESYLRRQIALARKQGANLIIFQLDSPGGQSRPADDLAERISSLEDVKTVAYIRDRALGLSSMLALACDEIVFHRNGKLGNVDAIINRRGNVEPLDDRERQVLADRAAALADRNGYPSAVARAMVDPSVAVIEALDRQAGAVVLISREEVEAQPQRFVEQDTLKPAGDILTILSDSAERFGLSRLVVDDDEQFHRLYNLSERLIRINGPSWVDALVSALNTPFMSGLLLFVGFFMLVLEMKLPGIGLPAITATLAFLLFFWSRYLGGTADGLEIILFVVGLICLALELFVFPGFGVFGMSGVLLVLISVVMASHTFVWPTEDTQYRQMGRTLLQVVLSLAGVFAGAVLLGRYFPSLPLFNRLILRPETEEDIEPDEAFLAKPEPEVDAPLSFLLGETGRTTTVLRPSGKARFGELLVDVTADGFFIERDCLVQIVDIQGARVIVKKL